MGALALTIALNQKDEDLKLTTLILQDNEIGKSSKFKEFVDEFSKLIEKDVLIYLDLSWNNMKGEFAKTLGSRFVALE